MRTHRARARSAGPGTTNLTRRGNWRPRVPGVKLLKYASVSVVSTCVTLTLLGTLVWTKTMTPGWANLVATAAGTVPSFELNRRWVWGKGGTRSLVKEVAPFCSLSFAGLGLSTLAVMVGAGAARRAGMSSGVVAAVSEGANLVTFAALWALQFVLLDKVLFRPASERQPTQPLPVEPTPTAAQSGVLVEPTPKAAQSGDGQQPRLARRAA